MKKELAKKPWEKIKSKNPIKLITFITKKGRLFQQNFRNMMSRLVMFAEC